MSPLLGSISTWRPLCAEDGTRCNSLNEECERLDSPEVVRDNGSKVEAISQEDGPVSPRQGSSWVLNMKQGAAHTKEKLFKAQDVLAKSKSHVIVLPTRHHRRPTKRNHVLPKPKKSSR
jgi:hypothetical protein